MTHATPAHLSGPLPGRLHRRAPPRRETREKGRGGRGLAAARVSERATCEIRCWLSPARTEITRFPRLAEATQLEHAGGEGRPDRRRRLLQLLSRRGRLRCQAPPPSAYVIGERCHWPARPERAQACEGRGRGGGSSRKASGRGLRGAGGGALGRQGERRGVRGHEA